MRGARGRLRIDEGRPRPSVSPRCVVAVPDDLYRVGLTHMLRADGVDVVAHTPTARGAIDLVRNLVPDVVVIEVGGPHAGPLAVRRLAGSEPAPRVLALSASPVDDDAIDALLAGASGYLPLGADAEVIAAGIRSVCAGELLVPARVGDALLTPLRSPRTPRHSEELFDDELSERELEVVALVARGLANKEVARELVVTSSTVKNHLTRIMSKLGARNRTHAAVLAAHRGYL